MTDASEPLIEPNANVTYTVKELLDSLRTEQTAGFARVEKGLEDKASRHELAAIREQQDRHQEKLDEHNHRIARVEDREAKDDAILEDRGKRAQWAASRKQFAVTTLIAVAGVLIGVGTALIFLLR